MTTAGVLLAAGGGVRFEGTQHKLLAPFRGRPLVTWALEALSAAHFAEAAVVAGAVDLGALVPPGVVIVDNPAWAQGQATSLQAAVAWAQERGHDAVVIGLGDQPLVPSAAWEAVAAGAAAVCVATFDGARRPPVKLARTIWELLPAEGDEGARVVMRARPDLVEEIPCSGEPVDIDSMEDMARWS
jgi:molybdenum cofactor cytidylyltransferase